MRLDRRLTFIGVMLVILSVTMATQYATTKAGYSYSIVHPSNADIRFIGSDNSTDGRVLRASGTNGTSTTLTLNFGNWSANSNKTYSAAFGIVNEELIAVNITHINVSTTTGFSYLQIWLHENRSVKATEDTGTVVYIWNNGTKGYTSSSTAWVLAAGNQDASDMSNGTLSISTPWDGTKGVRYSVNNTYAENGTSDYVWVQVSVNIPASPDTGGTHDGTIWIHFEATSS